MVTLDFSQCKSVEDVEVVIKMEGKQLKGMSCMAHKIKEEFYDQS